MKIEQTKIEPYWTQSLQITQIRTHAFFLIMMSSRLFMMSRYTYGLAFVS